MNSVVLDASALLTLLKGEPGVSKVASVIADAAISVVNLSQVVGHFVRAGMPARDVEDMLNALPLTLVPGDTALAWEAGRLRAETAEAGLSLGDRFCLALAKRDGLPAWTADKACKTVAALRTSRLS